MDNLASYYQEVCSISSEYLESLKLRWMENAQCGECGKQYTNKKVLRQHIIRMHQKRTKKNPPTMSLVQVIYDEEKCEMSR